VIPATTSRLLFLSPAFFGYEQDIAEAFRANGHEVDFYDERPNNSSLAKALFRVSPRISQKFVRSYYARILRETKTNQYNFVVVVKGEVVPAFFLLELRARNPEALLVYYSFDAMAPGSLSEANLGHYDKTFSFDPADVAKYPELHLKPLFYSTQFHAAEIGVARPHELTFVGTMHSDRYAFVSNLGKSFEHTFSFFYAPARWFFAVEKYVTRHLSEVAWAEISFSKLSKEEVSAVFRDSRAVLDLQRSNQAGLTMRTFEVLASGAILVTGNPAIRDADFYDPSRILVIEDYDSDGASERLRHELSRLQPDGSLPSDFEKYSVTTWVKELLS